MIPGAVLAQCPAIPARRDGPAEVGALLPAAQWIAPAATMLAATMTAANLGARTTGWGFVVFTIGSVAWALIGAASGQPNLLATNIFLTLVNGVGIWRWLGRQAKYQDGARAATVESDTATGPRVIAASALCGLEVVDRAGELVGSCVEALIDCGHARIAYVVVATRDAVGLNEELRGVPATRLSLAAGAVTLAIDAQQFLQLPILPDRNWPARL